MLSLIEAHNFVFLLDPQTNSLIEDKGYDYGDDEGIGTSCDNSDQLDHQLLGIARYQPGSTDSGEYTGKDGTEGTADAVNAKGIQ